MVRRYLSVKECAGRCMDEKPNIQALERLRGYAVNSDNTLIY